MKRRLTGWNVVRIIRLLLGIAALIQGIIEKETWMFVAGGVLLLGAILNLGCCGSSGCSLPTPNQNKINKIQYEEVDTSK